MHLHHHLPAIGWAAAIAVIALAVLLFSPVAAHAVGGARTAHVHPGGGHGHWHHRDHWGWGFGIGFGLGAFYDPAPVWVPGTVVVVPQGRVDDDPVSRTPALPEPVVEPRQGQSAAQTEADRQACNRWATTQAQAMVDAAVFHRMTLSCMEGRGYVVR